MLLFLESAIAVSVAVTAANKAVRPASKVAIPEDV